MTKLINGDCLEVLKRIPSHSIDLVVTDPPYDIETSGGGLYMQDDKQYVKELNEMKDGFSENILDELVRVMKKINIYFFCSQKQIIPLTDYFVTKRKCNWNIISWHKTNPVPACGNKYLTDTEYILFFREKGVKIYGEFETKYTYYVSPLNVKDKKLYNHPTCKPVEMLERFVVNSSLENQIVLDPFMGSGSMGVAAINKNRIFIGIEIKKEYYETAKNRLEETQLLLQNNHTEVSHC